MSSPLSTNPPGLASPPFVTVEGVHNFRDLGGYACTPRGSVQRGWIYRCAEPSQITEQGTAKLQELGVKVTYDLRSGPELENLKGRFDTEEEGEKRLGVDGIERVWCPVFKTQDYSPEKLMVRFQNYRKGPEVLTSFPYGNC
jgi:hypothetical protein